MQDSLRQNAPAESRARTDQTSPRSGSQIQLVRAGGSPVQCGWIKDPFGLSWQIVPRRFMELIRDKNPKKVKAVVDAMLTMFKLDAAALERAHAGA